MKLISFLHDLRERTRHSLKDSIAHRLIGERVFAHRLWAMEKSSVAGGLALGLFVAFTPTIPIQMLICAVCALYLKVNIPVSLLACWVTNPITAIPIYLSAHKLGQAMLKNSAIIRFLSDTFGAANHIEIFMEQSLYLWSGSLVFSTVAAIAGNVSVRLAWSSFMMLKAKAGHLRDKRAVD